MPYVASATRRDFNKHPKNVTNHSQGDQKAYILAWSNMFSQVMYFSN